MFTAALERINGWYMPWVGKLYTEGTFEEGFQMWYAERIKQWMVYPNKENARSFKFRSWDNRASYKGGWDNPKIQSAYNLAVTAKREKHFFYRYGGEPPPVAGELWGDWYDPEVHVVQESLYIPGIPVDVAFDPAFHRYSILFIQSPDEKHMNVIGELVLRKKDFSEIHREFWRLPWARDIRAGNSMVVCDIAASQNHQSLGTTLDLWKAPRKRKGMGLTPVYQFLHIRDQITVLQQALSGEHYTFRIHAGCTELIYDLLNERLDANGILMAGRNVGKDDCRKALSYYLALKKGTGLEKTPKRERKRAKGTGRSLRTRRPR
jgi:hypothetical protein